MNLDTILSGESIWAGILLLVSAASFILLVYFYLCLRSRLAADADKITALEKRDKVPKQEDNNEIDDSIVGYYKSLGTRAHQEDCAASFTDGFCSFAVVCDGMGGLDNGGLASSFCVSYLSSLYEADSERFRSLKQIIPDIKLLNSNVFNFTEENGKRMRCGTTLVACSVFGGMLNYISAGDSRIYVVGKDSIVKLTRDHNYGMTLDEKVQRGELSAHEAEQDPQREALISFVGIGSSFMAETDRNGIPVSPGDVVVLCSDGVTKVFSDEDIHRHINSVRDNDAKYIAKYLVEQSVRDISIAHDNTTVAIIKV